MAEYVEQAQHTSESSDWYSPPEYIEAARQLLGRIECDPASSADAQTVVMADRYYDKETDGLAPGRDWGKRIWLNPPSPAKNWWISFSTRCSSTRWRADGAIAKGVYFAYNIEQLSQIQGWTPGRLASCRICIPKKRVRFYARRVDVIDRLRAKISKLEASLETASLEIDEAFDDNVDPTLLQLESKLKRARIELGRFEEGTSVLVPGTQPTHASALIGCGFDVHEWAATMAQFGYCA